MTVKQVVTFTINKDLEKFKVQATEVVNGTRVSIFFPASIYFIRTGELEYIVLLNVS